MGLALNLRQIVGQLLQLDVVGNGPQFKHNAGTVEMRNSTDTGFVIARGSDPVGNNDFVTKGAGDLAYWRSVNPNWLVTDWYIDGVTGDDTNSGTVIGAPIKTGAELIRRLGPYAMWPQSVTVHVLANGMTDALVLRGLMMVAGNRLDIVGTPTQLTDAGTIATYTAVNHATPVATQITTTAVADWTAYRWRRLRITAGVRQGAISWIAKENPGGLGVATARISVPVNIDPVATATNVIAVAFAVGDPIIVESVPSVPSITLLLDGPIDITTVGGQYGKRKFSITDLSVSLLTLNTGVLAHRLIGLLFGCRIQFISLLTPPVALAVTQFSGCLFATTDPGMAGNLQISGIFMNCLFGDGTTNVAILSFSFFNACLFQGTRFVSNTSGAPIQSTNNQSFDNPSALSTVNLYAGTVSSWSGNGNAGVGFVCINGSVVTLKGTMNVQGATTNCQLGTAPTVNLTYPQFLQPNDYAQKGITPAMVAGTTTVTVPWYDNATQRVTVSHAAFAGTPGILSVQQISNTQFTITSSSALDTSTVNWTISALGRNIFISTV
jgi:hypothetical protein